MVVLSTAPAGRRHRNRSRRWHRVPKRCKPCDVSSCARLVRTCRDQQPYSHSNYRAAAGGPLSGCTQAELSCTRIGRHRTTGGAVRAARATAAARATEVFRIYGKFLRSRLYPRLDTYY